MAEFETRTVTAQVELRGDESTPTIVGHAATFNQPYRVGYFTEQIDSQAFDRTLRRDDSGNLLSDVRLLVDHEGQPLARTKSGTLRLGKDDRGLTVEADLDAANPKVQEITSAMKRGDLDQMSFGFRVPTGGDAWDHSTEPPLRTIREANLSGGDVSIVTYPANENTAVHLRSTDIRSAHYTLAMQYLTQLYEGRAVDGERLARVLDAMQGADTAIDGSLAAISDMLGVENTDVTQDANADPLGIRMGSGTYASNATTLTVGSSLPGFRDIGIDASASTTLPPIEEQPTTLPVALAQRLVEARALRRPRRH